MASKKNRAETLWQKAHISLLNYQNYIKQKSEPFRLTLIDLLYVSNFKGGNASVHEEESEVGKKLEHYSAVLKQIDGSFSGKALAGLSESETEHLIDCCSSLLSLGDHNETTAIDGFKHSFLSVLLHAHFPGLCPVLDRRVLINTGIVTGLSDLENTGQVRKIYRFYPALIRQFRKYCQVSKQSLRDLDKEYFIKQFPDWVRRSDVRLRNRLDS